MFVHSKLDFDFLIEWNFVDTMPQDQIIITIIWNNVRMSKLKLNNDNTVLKQA